jgi:hypothetical protein
MNLPFIPRDLLETLEDLYPDRCPDPSWSEREIWIKVGERNVINKLRFEYDEQTTGDIIHV